MGLLDGFGVKLMELITGEQKRKAQAEALRTEAIQELAEAGQAIGTGLRDVAAALNEGSEDLELPHDRHPKMASLSSNEDNSC